MVLYETIIYHFSLVLLKKLFRRKSDLNAISEYSICVLLYIIVLAVGKCSSLLKAGIRLLQYFQRNERHLLCNNIEQEELYVKF